MDTHTTHGLMAVMYRSRAETYCARLDASVSHVTANLRLIWAVSCSLDSRNCTEFKLTHTFDKHQYINMHPPSVTANAIVCAMIVLLPKQKQAKQDDNTCQKVHEAKQHTKAPSKHLINKLM